MVADIGHIKAALAIQGDAVWISELRLDGGSAIAGIAGRSRSRNGGDDACFGVDLANQVVHHFDEIHIALLVETNFVRLIEFGRGGRTSIAGVSLFAATGNSGELAGFQVDPHHAMVADFRDVERAVGPDFHAERLRNIHASGLPRAAVILGLPGSGNCIDQARRSS